MSGAPPPGGSGHGRVPGPMDASGIIAVRTGFLRMSRRLRKAPKRPRPPWALSLGLLALAAALGFGATLQRRSLEREFAESVRRTAAVPADVKRLRQDLADSEADAKTLGAQLDSQLKYLESVKSEDFFIVLDTAKKRFRFQYGDRVVRESAAEPGPAKTIEEGKRRWTFPALSGAFSIREKLQGADWAPPAWVYAMNRAPAPDPLPRIENGLGRYVIVLSGDAVIHSPPPANSPLKGVKPGSFLVPEKDLAAIWKRVGPRTRVYVF
ncbi:MAG: L,D-transpeptidase [Acidobacteriota bacterium]|nr:L,D-transpeptidase [Acidobacteriota bacterium]